VLPGVDGRPDFDGLHSRKYNEEVQFYAFDILVADGEERSQAALSMRKTNLARMFARRVAGIFLSDFELGEIGPDLFRHGAGGIGIQAQGSAILAWTLPALGEDEGPETPSHDAGAGCLGVFPWPK
jgi:hypothetical protein